jgi:hypothetical protein
MNNNNYYKYLKYKNKVKNLEQSGSAFTMQTFRQRPKEDKLIKGIKVYDLDQKSKTVELLHNPYVVYINPEKKYWFAFQYGKNKVIYGHSPNNKPEILNGCNYLKSLKILNDVLSEIRKNKFILAGDIALDKFTSEIEKQQLFNEFRDLNIDNFDYSSKKIEIMVEFFNFLIDYQDDNQSNNQLFQLFEPYTVILEDYNLLGGGVKELLLKELDINHKIVIIFIYISNKVKSTSNPKIIRVFNKFVLRAINQVVMSNIKPENRNKRTIQVRNKILQNLTNDIYTLLERSKFSNGRVPKNCPMINECQENNFELEICKIYDPFIDIRRQEAQLRELL